MLSDIMLEELEKMEEFIDFRNTHKLQKINKRKQRTILKKLKRVGLHQVLEKLSGYLAGKKDKEIAQKTELNFQTKVDMKDEDDGYCSEQTADLTSDDSDMEERTQLDICQFSRNYIKTYRRTDDEHIEDPKGLRPMLYRTTYRYAVYETMDR